MNVRDSSMVAVTGMKITLLHKKTVKHFANRPNKNKMEHTTYRAEAMFDAPLGIFFKQNK